MQKIENTLDEVFKKYKIQPVGRGFIDCICPLESIDGFITMLNELNIQIEGFTWWCDSNGTHAPCGLGGPAKRFGEGVYSEMPLKGCFEFHDNEEYRDYLLRIYPNSSDFKSCLVPGFWLRV